MSHPRNAVPPRERQKCRVDGCDRLEELANGRPTGGRCAGHRWRFKNHKPEHPPLDDAKAHRKPVGHFERWRHRLVASALAIAESETEEQFDRALRRLRRQAFEYVEQMRRKPVAPSTRAR